ncbi:MAG: hypothetical protein JW993_10210 [Sedimentisphaerales bacterium]|nr:hypothetical protein [Sedimentisphaerales bacterium]
MNYTARDLSSLTKKELSDIGLELGLSFSKNHNKQHCRRAILSAQAAAASTSPPPAHADSVSTEPLPVNPQFESLLGDDVDESGSDCPPSGAERSSGWGGARDGAGRPAGVTNAHAAVARLSEQPHPFVRSSLAGLFRLWSVRVKVDVSLSEQEAFDLALCYTQVGDYLGVTDKIPVWLQLAITTVWTTANVVSGKARLIRLEQAKRRAATEAQAA